MSWKDEFRQAMISFIAVHGSPDIENGGGYWWAAEIEELNEHYRHCGINWDLTENVKTVTWHEGGDTLDFGTEKTGLSARVVCGCGGHDQRMGYDGSMQDVLLAILAE